MPAAEVARRKAVILEQLAEIPLYWMAAAEAGVHPNTLANWRRDDADFDLACRKSRADSIRPHLHRMHGRDAADAANAARYLEKVAPAEFGSAGKFVDDKIAASAEQRRITFEVVRAS